MIKDAARAFRRAILECSPKISREADYYARSLICKHMDLAFDGRDGLQNLAAQVDRDVTNACERALAELRCQESSGFRPGEMWEQLIRDLTIIAADAQLPTTVRKDTDKIKSGAEIDIVLEEAHESSPDGPAEPEDIPLAPGDPASAVTRPGDVWCLGRHRLICGDARDRAVLAMLMGDERADLIFTDPPYNVPIDGHVTGLGRIRHREFAMGVGEMSAEAFTGFLQQTLGHAAALARDGAIAFVCMDWRHMGELLEAGQAVSWKLKNLCVWNKTNGGMGTFYRSKHELVFVFKVGTAAHTNTFGLGDSGRYRTNVWDFAGVNTMRAGRREDLAMHPTVKPVALVAEAIKDCSRRGEIVLDCFGGSGTTLMAAQKTGRLARLIECDPSYCDNILRRFERVTGKQATHAASATSFEDVSQERAAPSEEQRQ
jgi:DNA modification methylase